MTAQIIDGKQVAADMRAELKTKVAKLKEQGIDNITVEDVCGSAENADALGRPHLAAKLVEKGWVSNIKEAFDRYLKIKGESSKLIYEKASTQYIGPKKDLKKHN